MQDRGWPDQALKPGEDRPVVRPVYPSPMTLQYRERVDPPGAFEPPPASLAAQGYVWTSLVNMVDYQTESFAEKYVFGRAEQPYFARTWGWELQFWDPSTDNTRALMDLAHPVATLDLRMTLHVESFKVREDFYQVNLGMSEGSFSFHTRTKEEAEMWSQCAAQALLQHTRIKRMQWQEGVDRARDCTSHVEQVRPLAGRGSGGAAGVHQGDVVQLRYDVSPEREETLRRIWIQCLRAVADGKAAPAHAFAEMFALYNFDRDEDLDEDELEIMLRELLLVRRSELERALALLREQVVTPERIMLNPDALVLYRKDVGEPGDKLMKHYDHMLMSQGFESRAVLLRSQLDTSHDNRVSLMEFVHGAPQFLLPRQELFREVLIYRSCQKLKDEFLEHHEKEEEGCFQQ